MLRGGPGSEGTPFEIQPNSAGDYVLRLTTWKPQRRPVTPEEGTGWLDQGGLVYTVVGKTVEQNRRVFSCPDALVNDASVDSPTDPANTAEVPVNLTACLRNALGIDWAAQPVPVDLFVGAHSIYGDVAEGGGFAFKPKTAGASADQFTGTWRFPGGTAGTTIEWTVTANSAETGHFGIIAYSPRAVTGGTTPAGWTCHLGQAGPDADWDCTGGRLTPGQSVSGQVTLSQNGEDNMALSLLVCDDSNVCKGFGMTQQK